MKQGKLINPISLGSHGCIDLTGKIVTVVAEADAPDIFLRLLGIRTMYAVALPKSALSHEDLKGVKHLAPDLLNEFDVDVLEAQKPEGTVLVLSDNTEVEVL